MTKHPTASPVATGRSWANRHDDLILVPVSWYRGGTSKVFFVERCEIADLSPDERDRWILALFGSPDLRQIDGVGGADQVTSKFAIVGSPTRPGADIDYNFLQVGIENGFVTDDLNCGNVSAAVALYAIDRGYVRPAQDGFAQVCIHNLNDGKLLYSRLEVRGGKAVTEGDFVCEGVPGSGAPIALDFRDAVGGRTGKLFPTGNLRDTFDVPGYGEVEVSITEIANLIVFVPASAFGLRGNEDPVVLQNTPGLTAAVEWLRGAVATALGLATSPAEAKVQSPGTPFVALMSAPQDWKTFGFGVERQAGECDIMGRGYSLEAFTKAYWGTGSVCTGVVAATPGTVVNDLVRGSAIETGVIRIAHPSGVLSVEIGLDCGTGGGTDATVRKAALLRTARRMMLGTSEVPTDRVFTD